MSESQIKITLADHSNILVNNGISGAEIAKIVHKESTQKPVGILINDKLSDLSTPIIKDSTIKIITWEDQEGKQMFWHSSAHLMAEALTLLYPNVKFAIGPPIQNGFYYDIDLGEESLSPQKILELEKLMIRLAKKNNPYKKAKVSKNDAIEYFTQKNNEYKLHILNKLNDDEITFYTQGTFTDLCKGPHIPHTGFIKAIKIMNISSAYWLGDSNNKQLTRIYGISFPTQEELTNYINILEQAKQRDHRKLGKELKLFTFSDNVGIGLPLWLPNGTIIREALEKFLRQKQKEIGYQPVITPHIAQKSLFIMSGHYEKYGKDSFQPITTPNANEEFLIKPMNCPHHCEIYKSELRSYKDLPIRMSEFGTVYRYEQHGELHGLARTRSFTQDDAHIFCTSEQVREEISKVIDLTLNVFEKLGFDNYTIQISLRDPNNLSKYIGTNQDWENAEEAIEHICKEKKLNITYAANEAAFYGPKLDFMVKDALGRSWQLGTIQLDYQLPQRFNLEYTGKDNQKHTPVIIHRAPFGSLERIIAILLEHTNGKLPLWLAPVQIIILPISEKYIQYAQKINQSITSQAELRIQLDNRVETIGKKIREAEANKIPFIIVVGEKEEANNIISVRKQGRIDLGSMSVEQFFNLIKEYL
jgi:threonyl-tRNA synthetase